MVSLCLSLLCCICLRTTQNYKSALGRMPLMGRSLVGKPNDSSSGNAEHLSRDQHYAFANINSSSSLFVLKDAWVLPTLLLLLFSSTALFSSWTVSPVFSLFTTRNFSAISLLPCLPTPIIGVVFNGILFGYSWFVQRTKSCHRSSFKLLCQKLLD